MEKKKVYFTKDISSKSLLKIYQALDKELTGPIAVKVHSGEAGNQNFLRPIFYKDLMEYTNGTVVECNTAYDGQRNTSEKHLKLLDNHEWTKYYKVDLLDEKGEMPLDINYGKYLTKNYVGENLKNYESLLVVSHFKGHPMGGYGGALKNISIGLASSYGKAIIHGP